MPARTVDAVATGVAETVPTPASAAIVTTTIAGAVGEASAHPLHTQLILRAESADPTAAILAALLVATRCLAAVQRACLRLFVHEVVAGRHAVPVTAVPAIDHAGVECLSEVAAAIPAAFRAVDRAGLVVLGRFARAVSTRVLFAVDLALERIFARFALPVPASKAPAVIRAGVGIFPTLPPLALAVAAASTAVRQTSVRTEQPLSGIADTVSTVGAVDGAAPSVVVPVLVAPHLIADTIATDAGSLLLIHRVAHLLGFSYDHLRHVTG